MKNNVLVMDSDFLSNWFLTKTFRDIGYHVVAVSDIDSLMKRLSVDSPHAVVIRVDWSDINTGAAIETVRAMYPEVRVIVYAPHAGKSLRDKFEKENVRYFQHPFRANEIRQALT